MISRNALSYMFESKPETNRPKSLHFFGDDSSMINEKLGLMYDADGNVIAFSGSMNESAKKNL